MQSDSVKKKLLLLKILIHIKFQINDISHFENDYQKGIKVTEKELLKVSLVGDAFHPEWNYTIMHN